MTRSGAAKKSKAQPPKEQSSSSTEPLPDDENVDSKVKGLAAKVMFAHQHITPMDVMLFGNAHKTHG